MRRSTLQAFTAEHLIPLLSRDAAQLINTEFPPVPSPARLNRIPFKLNLPKFRCGRPRPLLLVRRPEATPLSDYSLWRSQLYRSFNAHKRIGLHRDFAEDVREALKERPSVPLARALRLARKKRLAAANPTSSTAIHSSNSATDVCFEYTFSKPLSRQIELGPPINVTARRDCLFYQLAIPLFSWSPSQVDDPDSFPTLKVYSEEGALLSPDRESANKLSVQDVMNLNARFASFGSQLFRMKFTESKRQLDVTKPYMLTPIYSLSRKCEACKVHNAEVEVSESLVLPLTPCYLCKTCYNELHPESNEGAQYGFVELLTLPEPSTST